MATGKRTSRGGDGGTGSDRARAAELGARPRAAPAPSAPSRILVKLRSSGALKAAGSRVGLRPLFDSPGGRSDAFGVGAEPRWYVADLPESAATPWDLAHARVADQLGVAESDVVFVEPDIVHDIYLDPDGAVPGARFELTKDCTVTSQNDEGGQAVGPHDTGWHLDDEFSQLRKARGRVTFEDPRTRIAHLDTGYDRRHANVPEHVRTDLERSFVEDDPDAASAQDPDRRAFPIDNSGHGTGTLGILAGGRVAGWQQDYLGGAPQAEVVPLRIADTVVLLKTSSFARALEYAVSVGCDVVSMSMGGLPSRAWREAVDRAYEAGVFMATAAGNNFNALPTRNLVYPARYARVVAVCGVMANGKAYADIEGWRMEGNYGPKKKMAAAMAAYTPNIPWARFGCPDAIRLNGGGTSSATPQVAAAAALWFEKYKHVLPRDWRRVEAMRHALFETARRKRNRKQFGRGTLRAADALGVRPVMGLPKTKSDKDWFALFRVLTGLGITEPTPRELMFNLELQQRWLLSSALQELVEDPEDVERLEELSSDLLRKVMEAIIEDDGASLALRRHVAARYPVVTGSAPTPTARTAAVVPPTPAACDDPPALRAPAYRRLRVYASDPGLSTRLETAAVNEVTLRVRWETLAPGPVGEYLAVEDVDASGKRYAPVALDAPALLAQDGWAPSEGNAQFHQQMVYAVAMKTIGHFEQALGRPALWRPRPDPQDPLDDSGFVQRLAVRPHGLRQANAFYSPGEVALRFGYFDARPEDPGEQVPGSRVYTCLSHDIVAHETTHALLDGMYRRFNEPTNPDVLAFHEAFADLVALLQHFTISEVLEAEIGRTRGDLAAASRLGSLAVQFGVGIGRRGALREAIGRIEEGVWRRLEPDPAELDRRLAPHQRGAVLVAAVFDAFLAIHRERAADLIRIATGGTGVLPEGALHPDLVRRLANEAAKSARHVLTMCIRALDYLPPVDVTFFEYLRALITADYDLVRDDRHNYRVAFVEAFRRRGIHPEDAGRGVRAAPPSLSVETLRWSGVDRTELSKKDQAAVIERYGAIVEGLKEYADACTYFHDRKELFTETRRQRRALHGQLVKAFEAVPTFARHLGVDPERSFEVHELRRAMRVDPDGRVVPQVIVGLTQARTMEAGEDGGVPEHLFRGGSTLVVDLERAEVKYRIVKNIASEHRQARTAAFLREAATDPLRGLLFGSTGREPFAALHALADVG